MNGQIVGKKWVSLQFLLPTFPSVYLSFDCVVPMHHTTPTEQKLRVKSSSLNRKKATKLCDSVYLHVDPLSTTDGHRCQSAYRSPRHVAVIHGTFIHFMSLHLSLPSQQTVRTKPRVRP